MPFFNLLSSKLLNKSYPLCKHNRKRTLGEIVFTPLRPWDLKGGGQMLSDRVGGGLGIGDLHNKCLYLWYVSHVKESIIFKHN